MGFFSKKRLIKSEKRLIDYLPIGSIITLRNSPILPEDYPYKTELFMIIDYREVVSKKIDGKKCDVEMDYSCVRYPLGYISLDEVVRINHDDIDEIIFYGYNSEEREEFCKNIDRILEEERENV